MIKQIIDFGKNIFGLTQKTIQQDKDIENLQKRVEILEKSNSELFIAVQTLALKMQHDRELAKRDRENLLLRLEIALSREQRTLPTATESPAPRIMGADTQGA